MGARANIVLNYNKSKEDGEKEEKYSNIYLYSHWGGETIKELLARALKRGKERWDDHSYLARIIFSEMVKEDIEGKTGFGISPYPPDNEYPLLHVDMENQNVKEENGRRGRSYQEFIDRFLVSE